MLLYLKFLNWKELYILHIWFPSFARVGHKDTGHKDTVEVLVKVTEVDIKDYAGVSTIQS